MAGRVSSYLFHMPTGVRLDRHISSLLLETPPDIALATSIGS